jgi:hypothetical protein
MSYLARRVRDAVLQAVDDHTASREWLPVQRLSATGSCMRQQYYNLTEAEERTPIPQGSTWEIRDGDLHEGDIKHYLRAAGYTITNEQDSLELSLADGSIVSGHPDGVIAGPGLLVPHLLEIKSMSFIRYADLVKHGVAESDPSIYLQINGYMEALALPYTLLVAKAKDSSAVKRSLSSVPEADPKLHVEVVPYDYLAAQTVRQRHLHLAERVARFEPPEREYNIDRDWQCEWCAFRHTCWGEDADERIEQRKKGRGRK